MIQVLVFDWGNTVMKEYPEYLGAMVNWPKVAAVEGIESALASLHGRYRLVIGTNAQNSSTSQVRAALERVHLGSYFTDVLTYAELNARKPDEAFYRAIEARLGMQSGEGMMIGDIYSVDVLGAWNAGWRSAWYNPAAMACPAHLPVHEIEIQHMQDLPGLLEQPELPPLKTCLTWLQDNGASGNLLVHVQMVAACAYQMALWMNQHGTNVNPILAHRGGLLHDLAKLWPDKHVDHGLAACNWLKEKGQEQLAEIASRHMIFEILHEERKPRTWEEKLVYLADKMIEKNAIVSVDERIAGLKTRYRMEPELVQRAYPLMMELQQEVCSAAGVEPQELPSRLAQATSNG